MSEYMRRASEGSLPAADLTGHVRVVPTGPRRLAKIERQRTQMLGFAKREQFAVSGRPSLAEPSAWKVLALLNMASSMPEDK